MQEVLETQNVGSSTKIEPKKVTYIDFNCDLAQSFGYTKMIRVRFT